MDKPNEMRLPDSKQPNGVSTSQPAPMVVSIPSLVRALPVPRSLD